jgi:HTH-type transcriptional regulator / antitoxin HigA
MLILNQRDYRRARARREQLGKALSGTVPLQGEGVTSGNAEARRTTLSMELERIEDAVRRYERLRELGPEGVDETDQLELGLLPILVRLSKGLSQRDLAGLLGMREQQVQRYEKDRYASISLARYQQILFALGVDIEARVNPIRMGAPDSEDFDIDLSPELLRELRRRAWVSLPRNAAPSEMRRSLAQYVLVNSAISAGPALNRRTRSKNPKGGAVELWVARVLEIAADQASALKGRFNIADTAWLSSLVQLSVFPDGPVRALKMLNDHGIATVIEPHLPKSLLDGAAMLTKDGVPVVALTIRHDRVDNFWFTLVHELGHVYLHFRTGLESGFIDDDLGNHLVDDMEREADEFARSVLIPDDQWAQSTVRFTKSPDIVEKFARRLNVHPAIVAGRIRSEKDYRLFSDLVGVGQVRCQFLPE